MSGTLGELAYEEHRIAVGLVGANGQPLKAWRELVTSNARRDVVEVAAWEAAAEKVEKVVRNSSVAPADTTEARPWVDPRANPEAGSRP